MRSGQLRWFTRAGFRWEAFPAEPANHRTSQSKLASPRNQCFLAMRRLPGAGQPSDCARRTAVEKGHKQSTVSVLRQHVRKSGRWPCSREDWGALPGEPPLGDAGAILLPACELPRPGLLRGHRLHRLERDGCEGLFCGQSAGARSSKLAISTPSQTPPATVEFER